MKFKEYKNEVDFFNLIERTSFGGSWGLSLDYDDDLFYETEALKKQNGRQMNRPFFCPKFYEGYIDNTSFGGSFSK